MIARRLVPLCATSGERIHKPSKCNFRACCFPFRPLGFQSAVGKLHWPRAEEVEQTERERDQVIVIIAFDFGPPATRGKA